jgi:hypothetical protein
MWKPRRLTTLWTSTAFRRDSFNLFFTFYNCFSNILSVFGNLLQRSLHNSSSIIVTRNVAIIYKLARRHISLPLPLAFYVGIYTPLKAYGAPQNGAVALQALPLDLGKARHALFMLSGLSNNLQPVYPSSLRTGAEVEHRLPAEHGCYSRGCRVILQEIRMEESRMETGKLWFHGRAHCKKIVVPL